MRIAILIFIKAYWALIPAHKRRSCIFSKSCSRHVFDISKAYGFIKGLQAFLYRFNNCRPGHKMFLNPFNDKMQIILANGEVLEENEISEHILSLYPHVWKPVNNQS